MFNTPADAVVVLDTSAAAQLEGVVAGLRSRREKVVVVDHHATSEDLGAVQWVDVSAAAAGVQAAEIIEALGWPVDSATAEALMVMELMLLMAVAGGGQGTLTSGAPEVKVMVVETSAPEVAEVVVVVVWAAAKPSASRSWLGSSRSK